MPVCVKIGQFNFLKMHLRGGPVKDTPIEKYFFVLILLVVRSQNRTWDGRVGSPNTTSMLSCPPPLDRLILIKNILIYSAPLISSNDTWSAYANPYQLF